MVKFKQQQENIVGYIYYPFEQTTNCGGWASPTGPCGSDECENCYPGCGGPVESERDLTGHGFQLDIDDLWWWRKIQCSEHVARRDHKDGKVKKGQRYTRTTTRWVSDETGETWLSHNKRLVSRPC